MHIKSLTSSFLICAQFFASAGAQSISATGIAGNVVTDVDGRPLGQTKITLRELGRTTETDSLGAFRMVGLAAGTYTLLAKRIGFGLAVASISVQDGKILEVEIGLQALAVQNLPRMQVTADSQQWGKLAAFDVRRLAHSGGKFLQAPELDSARGHTLSDVIRSSLVSASIVLYARTGAELIVSKRGIATIIQLPRADPSDDRSPRACFSQVYLDGVKIYSPMVSGGAAAPDMRRFRPETFAGVEYYSGPAVTPPEFGGTGAECGTIVLWTRDR